MYTTYDDNDDHISYKWLNNAILWTWKLDLSFENARI